MASVKNLLSAALVSFLFIGCTVSKPNYHPNKKYDLQQLRDDYNLFRNILEESHPGLYWYTPKDTIDHYFEWGQSQIRDSMTEVKFRNVLSYVLSKVRCGHTTVRASKQYSSYTARVRMPVFPFSVKAWPDTAVITATADRKDSLMRGVVLTTIDGKNIKLIIDSLSQYLSTDGYNTTHKFQSLSNRGNFGSLYTSVFGGKARYQVSYIDTSGSGRTTTISTFIPPKDTSKKTARTDTTRKLSKRQRKSFQLQSTRRLRFDSSMSLAYMDLNTFTKGYRLKRFFRSSFKELNKQNTANLIIDLRGNGGGNVMNSNLLTKYIASAPFKLADSLYALRRGSKYGKYQQNRFFNWLLLSLFARKRADGYYHFSYFEKKFYRPKKKNHFDKDVYILTGGNTFSASTLFINAVVNQQNVTVVGEETGGGAYGNNAWIIPDVTLPNTKIRFRLPLFRLVIDKDLPKGRGILPEVESLPTVNSIRKNIDFKTQKAKELIQKKKTGP